MKKLSLLLATLLSTSVYANNLQTYSTDFSEADLTKWTHEGNGTLTIENGVLSSDALSVSTLNGTQLDSNYEVSMTVDFEGNQGTSKGLLFGYKDINSPFYSLHLKGGTWGKLLVYKHQDLYSGQRELIYTGEEHSVSLNEKHVLKVKLEKDNLNIYLNGIKEKEMIHYFGDTHVSKKVGMFSLGNNKGIESFTVHTPDNYETDFGLVESTPLEILSGEWSLTKNLSHSKSGIMATVSDFNVEGDYSTRMVWNGNTSTSDGLVFSFTDLNSSFYEARIEKQTDYTAALVLYKHDTESSLGVLLNQSSAFNYTSGEDYEIKVQVRGTSIKATVNGENLVKYNETTPLTGRKAGILGINPNSDSKIKYFEITR